MVPLDEATKALVAIQRILLRIKSEPSRIRVVKAVIAMAEFPLIDGQ